MAYNLPPFKSVGTLSCFHKSSLYYFFTSSNSLLNLTCMLSLFKRSFSKCNIRFSNYIGDAECSTFRNYLGDQGVDLFLSDFIFAKFIHAKQLNNFPSLNDCWSFSCLGGHSWTIFILKLWWLLKILIIVPINICFWGLPFLAFGLILSVVFVSVGRHVAWTYCMSAPEILFIVLQEELESLTSNYPDRFKVYYVLNQVSSIASFLVRIWSIDLFLPLPIIILILFYSLLYIVHSSFLWHFTCVMMTSSITVVCSNILKFPNCQMISCHLVTNDFCKLKWKFDLSWLVRKLVLKFSTFRGTSLHLCGSREKCSIVKLVVPN